MKMDLEQGAVSDEKIYWIQICISIVFGIASYYILEMIFTASRIYLSRSYTPIDSVWN